MCAAVFIKYVLFLKTCPVPFAASSPADITSQQVNPVTPALDGPKSLLNILSITKNIKKPMSFVMCVKCHMKFVFFVRKACAYLFGMRPVELVNHRDMIKIDI